MIHRAITAVALQAAKEFPILTIVGPRQSGKTTLSRALFPDYRYVSLEAPDVRAYAREDPRGFLDEYRDQVIFDEIQRVPDLLSYLQTRVDEDPRPGRFLLTGSQHFLMMRDVSQSLAGRTAILRLLPLELEEIRDTHAKVDANALMRRGFYPRLYERDLDPYSLYRDYFQTYVERDVRSLSRVQDLHTFETFVRLCAGRVGQVLNLTSLGNDAGVSATTVREWISLLETSFILFRLNPFHANLGKRLTKSPKLYFHDVGLATYLCGIEEDRQLNTHPLRGSFFENLVVSDFLKHRFNQGRDDRLCFYRDSGGNEVDLLVPMGPDWLPVEVKAGKTLSGDAYKGLKLFNKIRTDAGPPGIVVYGGDTPQHRSVGTACGLWDMQSKAAQHR